MAKGGFKEAPENGHQVEDEGLASGEEFGSEGAAGEYDEEINSDDC
jgi:hypothetical protein